MFQRIIDEINCDVWKRLIIDDFNDRPMVAYKKSVEVV